MIKKEESMNLELLHKSQSLYNKSIEVLQIDKASSLFMSRKNLEMVIHSYYEENNLPKKEEQQKYPELYWMMRNLKERNDISKTIFATMDYIRKNANKAIHEAEHSVGSSVANNCINKMASILIWYLKSSGSTENTYFLMLVNRSNSKSEDTYAVELHNALADIFEFRISKKPRKFYEALETIEKFDILDEDWDELVDANLVLLERFDEFDDNFVERNFGFKGIIDEIVNAKKQTASEIFSQLNSDKIYEIEKLKEKIYDKYFK